MTVSDYEGVERRKAHRVQRNLLVKYRQKPRIDWWPSESDNISATGVRLSGTFFLKKMDVVDLRFVISGQIIDCKLRITEANRESAAGYFYALRSRDRTIIKQLIGPGLN